MDIFEAKNIEPMLIASESAPFDSDQYLYELKFDGARAIAYLDGNTTEIRNKRNKSLTAIIPELQNIHTYVNTKVILDGEIIVMKDNLPNFYALQKRTLLTNPTKISLASMLHPITFICYDILYWSDTLITNWPLWKRKNLLAQVIIQQNDRFLCSTVVENKGIPLFMITKEKGLEGVIAKKKDSLYYFGKRTKDWIKFKNTIDDDFVVLGYIRKKDGFISLILGQYSQNQLQYSGHVTLGVKEQHILSMQKKEVASSPLATIPPGNEKAVWLEPTIVAIVQLMDTADGNFRQPVLKGFRDDKDPKSCLKKT